MVNTELCISSLTRIDFIHILNLTESGIKIENDTDSLLDMYDEKFYVRLEQSFAKLKNDNNKSGTAKVKEEHETYPVITEISEIGHSAVSGKWVVFVYSLHCLTFFIL